MVTAFCGRFRSVILGCTVLGVIAGCGVSEKKLQEAEARIEALRQKGVPDTVLSGPKVMLFQARTALKLGDAIKARKSADSAIILITKSEADLSSAAQNLKPVVDSMVASLGIRKKALTGLHFQVADSMMKIIDSLTALNWMSQARDKCVETDPIMTALTEAEAVALKTRPKLIGTWTRTEKSDFGGTAKNRFSFKKDGSLELMEEKKGQSSPELKEEWKFLSSGSYDLRGDTVFMFINREKCLDQTFWNLQVKNGKKDWIKSKQPTYDTTITNGAKDRFVEFGYLTQYFKK